MITTSTTAKNDDNNIHNGSEIVHDVIHMNKQNFTRI